MNNTGSEGAFGLPPPNPFSTDGATNDFSNITHDNFDSDISFDAFSLTSSSTSANPSMPSLQQLQFQQQMQQQQMQQQQMQQQQSMPMQQTQQMPQGQQQPPQQTPQVQQQTQWHQGKMDSSSNWPPPPPSNSSLYPTDSAGNVSPPPTFLSRLLSCCGCCSIEALRPHFDVDTADILTRMKGSIKYCNVPDGFRNEVLYSNRAFSLEYRDTGNVAGVSAGDGSSAGISAPSAGSPSAMGTDPGKGPDLYGPVWITMTLVFFVAVTSNISIYVHANSASPSPSSSSSEEWDYDINHLLRATSILYSFSLGLPFVLFLVFRVLGITSLSFVDLACLYGYSLVPYLPTTWLCIIPLDWLNWVCLGISSAVSGLLVLRNVTGAILDSTLMQSKGGGLVMSVMGCHFVFFLVMKLAFYRHY